jgi:hypothetical protein
MRRTPHYSPAASRLALERFNLAMEAHVRQEDILRSTLENAFDMVWASLRAEMASDRARVEDALARAERQRDDDREREEAAAEWRARSAARVADELRSEILVRTEHLKLRLQSVVAIEGEERIFMESVEARGRAALQEHRESELSRIEAALAATPRILSARLGRLSFASTGSPLTSQHQSQRRAGVQGTTRTTSARDRPMRAGSAHQLRHGPSAGGTDGVLAASFDEPEWAPWVERPSPRQHFASGTSPRGAPTPPIAPPRLHLSALQPSLQPPQYGGHHTGGGGAAAAYGAQPHTGRASVYSFADTSVSVSTTPGASPSASARGPLVGRLMAELEAVEALRRFRIQQAADLGELILFAPVSEALAHSAFADRTLDTLSPSPSPARDQTGAAATAAAVTPGIRLELGGSPQRAVARGLMADATENDFHVPSPSDLTPRDAASAPPLRLHTRSKVCDASYEADFLMRDFRVHGHRLLAARAMWMQRATMALAKGKADLEMFSP